MKINLKKNVELGVLFGLICAIVLSFARFEAQCDELRANVLRLHIIANSDSTEDQQLKLAVRDAILEESTDIFKECENLEQAYLTADKQLEKITDIANEIVKENGFDYEAKASVGDSYFNTREYDDFTLPAGNYKSLIVNLGKSEGKNWWCVIFPCICVPAAGDAELSNSVSKETAKTAENPKKYVVRFKTVEIYEKIKRIFSKN